MKFFFTLIILSGFSVCLFAQENRTDSSPVREGVFTFTQKACDTMDMFLFSMPGDYGSPRDMTSTIYISNDTLASVKTSSLPSQAFKTILIPEDSCIYFILNDKTICFEEHQSQNTSLLSSKYEQTFEHIETDTLEEIEGFSTLLFRQYQVDSSSGQMVVDTLDMWGTTEVKSAYNMSIEDDQTYDVLPLKFMLKSQYGCFVMELTEFEKTVPHGVFDFDRSKVEYYYNMEEFLHFRQN